jgi:hypothetical protein
MGIVIHEVGGKAAGGASTPRTQAKAYATEPRMPALPSRRSTVGATKQIPRWKVYVREADQEEWLPPIW